jgi:hypothetical protein
MFDTLVRWGLARPGLGPADCSAAGTVRGAARRRPSHRLRVDLATVCTLAAKVEPYLRADDTRIWSLMQLERQLRPEAYGRRRGGYLDRRQTPATDASPIRRLA